MSSYLELIEKELSLGNKNFQVGDITFRYVKNTREIEGFIVLFETDNIDFIYEIYNYLINKEYKIHNMILNLSDYNITQIDYTKLGYINNYCKKAYKKDSFYLTDIYIKYGDINNTNYANYDDYMSMIESLKWYKSLLNENELSPLEKLTYAYDIAKTFEYSDSNNTGNDNTLHFIIKTGNIVCLGYNRFMCELLNSLDNNIVYSEFTTYCYKDKNTEIGAHSRGIVRIDDDKYNIHGIYICDPTWDSINNEYKKIYGEEYNALSGYRYFLVPISKYRRFFKGDTYPRIFRGLLYGNEKRLTNKRLNEMIMDPSTSNIKIKDSREINNGFKQLLPEYMTYKDFLKYLKCNRPNVETFANMIYRVRECEGYDINTINNTIVFGIWNEYKDQEIYFISDDDEEKVVL